MDNYIQTQFTEIEILEFYFRTKSRHLNLDNLLTTHLSTEESVPVKENSVDVTSTQICNPDDS